MYFETDEIAESMKINFSFAAYQFNKFLFGFTNRWRKELKDLETKTFETFKIVYDFIQKISKSEKKFDDEKAKKIIQECEFDKLQRLEKINGFREAMTGKNNNEKLRFFNGWCEHI